MFRWRWQGKLLTTPDYMVDPAMRERIDKADAKGEEFVRGVLPEARFNLEDVTRFLVLGFLRRLGWDGETLIRVLRKPYIEPFATQSDGHTARDQRVMPPFLVIFPELERDRWNRLPLDRWDQVQAVLAQYAAAIFVPLYAFREEAQHRLADVERERERRAALLAEAQLRRAKAREEAAQAAQEREREKV